MKRFIFIVLSVLTLGLPICSQSNFVGIKGMDLIRPDGSKLFILGTNLGNWLNPEGYMFGFSKTNSAWMIDQMFREMVGPDATDDFWRDFKDNYITRKDIDFIASTGANTIRLPFNYKLFTDVDYMGLVAKQDGFTRVDSLLSWCRDNNLYLILDMHDCPAGQTGDNIDDGYGYPWLFYSERAQQQFCEIWKEIAKRYKNEPTILGYELMNEPIAHYFENKEEINKLLEPLYKRAVKAIREVDSNHIILLGGSQWNGNFEPFSDWKFDNKIMYTCHRYGGGSGQEAFQSLIDFRDKTGLPMYMGEIGHNTDQWQKEVCLMMHNNNIGYTFWPYKKIDNSCMMGIKRPEGWNDVIVKFSETSRQSFHEFREARPNQELACNLMRQFIENCKFENCMLQEGYVNSLLLKPEQLKAAKREVEVAKKATVKTAKKQKK